MSLVSLMSWMGAGWCLPASRVGQATIATACHVSKVKQQKNCLGELQSHAEHTLVLEGCEPLAWSCTCHPRVASRAML